MTATLPGRTRAPSQLRDERTEVPPAAIDRGWRRPAIVVAAILLAGAAELPLIRVFGPPGLRMVLMAAPAAGIVAAAAATWLGRAGRDPHPPAVAGLIAGLMAGALPGMLLAPADPYGPASLGSRLEQAATDGWYRLLSVPVPVPYTRSFTDLPFLIAAILSAAIMVTALSRHPGGAVILATLGFGGLLVLGSGGPAAGTALSGGYAVAVLIFMMCTAPAVRRRAAGTALASAAVLVTIAALVTSAAHPGAAYNPRANLRVPLNVSVAQDPLALLSARLETPDTPVLTAQLSGGLLQQERGWNWVVLTYDDYDGAGWQQAGTARSAVTGTKVPGPSQTGTAQITLAKPAALLPHPADVLGTDGADLAYSPSAEMLASPSPMSRYSVSVSVPEQSAAELADAPLPSAVPVGLTQTPACTPAALVSVARAVRQAANLPAEQALRLQDLLSSAPFRYDQLAAPGEGCGSIENMLVTRKGTSAQFATAFILTARLLGIPARLAVGYAPGTFSGDTEFVTDADAYAWPQVELYGTGWVDFQPDPKDGSAGGALTSEKLPALRNLQTSQPKDNQARPAPDTRPSPTPRGTGALTRPLLTAGAAVALVLAWMTAVRLWSARRRRRRRQAAEPAARVLGGWEEILLPLRQAGIPIAGRSAPSVAKAVATILPDETYSVAQLAAFAERALYAEVSQNDADLAWQLSDRVRGAANTLAGFRARLRRTFWPVRTLRSDFQRPDSVAFPPRMHAARE